jgi:origin recognition complex subunit 4
VPLGEEEDVDGWKELWGGSVNRFLEERSVKTALHETWALVKDVRMLTRILVRFSLPPRSRFVWLIVGCVLETTPVLMLSPTSPFLTPASLLNSIAEQRCPVGNTFLTCKPSHF